MIAYKYRGGHTFDRDLDSIAEDYFYAAGIDKLNDPFEATYSIAPVEQVMQFAEFVVGKDSAMTQLGSQLSGILSKVAEAGVFSMAERPDDLKLWSHYASNHTGFCVGYEVELLEKFNSDAHHANYVIKVKYAEQPPALSMTDVRGRNIAAFLQKVIGTKHPEWAHEAETRVVTDKVGRMPHDFRAIKSIYFGLHMPQEQIEAMMQRMQGRGIKYYKMQRKPATYGLTAILVPDLFADAPRYLYHIAPVAEYALNTYAEGEEKQLLLPYLHKAVEVQRRDPYCSEVLYAERCSAKDRTGQIYVHYRYNDSHYNRYFTKNEVDKMYAQLTDLSD